MSLKSTIISLVPFPIYEEKPGLFPGRYSIKASDMKTPEILHVETAYHFVYLDENRKQLRVPDPSDQVARAIVEDYTTSQLGVDEAAKPALFWEAENLTLEQVKEVCKFKIVEAILHQKAWMLNVVRIADNDWNRYHQHNVVSDFQRKCAQFIGWKPEDHEWMSEVEMDKCPVCQSSVAKNAIICVSCKHILNEEAAREKGLKFATV